jgi:hypothetical protein
MTLLEYVARGPHLDRELATRRLQCLLRLTAKLEQVSAGRAVEILSAILVSSGKELSTREQIPSGAPLTLRVTGKSAEPLDDVTFAFMIYRSTDQLLVYNGHVQRRELGTLGALVGEFTLDLHFRANLVRGHYYIALHVVHNPTQESLVPIGQVATLSIQETRSRDGIADVGLSATVSARTAERHADAVKLSRM